MKYTTLDELHENNPGFTIGVVLGNVKGLVSTKFLILPLFVSRFKFPDNVTTNFAVGQKAFKIRRLSICNAR